MDDKNILSILIIDDDSVIRKVLESILRRAGYNILQADNGKEGFEIALRENPEIILLDVKMPNESGFDVIIKLKENTTTVNIPVIFITGNSDISSKVKGFQLGAVDYVVKPIHAEEVLARVNLHIKLSKSINVIISSQAEKIKHIKESQRAMLIQPGELPEARFNVFYKPLNEAGGDIYDALQISDGIYGYFLGDVAGHDMGTSLITAFVKALLKQNCKQFNTPSESMGIINNVLVELLSEEQYITACYILVNRIAKMISVISMGHPPVFFIPKQGEANFINTKGIFLGVFENSYFKSVDMKVSMGDRFIIYTDGLFEKLDREKYQSYKEKLHELAPFLHDSPLEKLPYNLYKSMFDEKERPTDDITVLSVEV
ncbi:MAG: fused response regulator/phosphatase [Chitinispirillia bacterium]|jgi:sigma-B regulation protein RsbU (phosphoserine phosphatase)